MSIIVNLNLCPQNHACPAVTVCPEGALTQTRYNAPMIDGDKCIDCGKCVNYCPMRAFINEVTSIS
ncbi:MAG: 4Fe-4S binding protein [Firmicutes bacterium]|nr:4Fe-4S binding protein [Bacillota bacterium]